MNTEQTTKPLGKICEENYWSSERPSFERAAQAVATEVLKRHGISPVPEQQPQLGSPEGLRMAQWESPPAVPDTPLFTCPCCCCHGEETCDNPDHGFIGAVGGELARLGCPVCGSDPHHKVRGGGKCDICNGTGEVTEEKGKRYCKDTDRDWEHEEITPPPAPRAEWKHGMAGNQVQIKSSVQPAPWKLPEPPEGDWKAESQKWWERCQELLARVKEMEMAVPGWKHWKDDSPEGGHYTAPWDNGKGPGKSYPAPPAPQQEEIPYEETDLFHARKALLDEGMRANTLKQERDAALARASEAEKQVETLRRKTDGRGVLSVTEEDETYREQCWKMMYSSVFLELEKQRKQVAALSTENTALRASVPVWVPCNRVMPTQKDANAHGRVLFGSLDSIAWSAPWNEVKNATHWMALPPLPVETEEGENMMQIRAEFEEWAEANGYHVSKAPEHSEYFNIYTAKMWDSWQAALRSKKPS
jgi:hypothetical protein